MNIKAKGSFVLFLLSLLLVIAAVINNASAVDPANQKAAPSPPTRGPEPTLEPYRTMGGEPIEDEIGAIHQALIIDSDWAFRDQTLTEEYLMANPDKVIVEYYPTRQEAEAIYLGGGSPIEDIASEPVWVVRFKGDTFIRVVGGGRRGGREESINANGVTYIISQKTGDLLAISGSAQTRSERLSEIDNND